MALTNTEIQQVIQALKSDAQGVEELKEVTSLEGVSSLPAMKGNEMVKAPLILLQEPAKQAAVTANNAAAKADASAAKADSATASANTAKQSATEAAASANQAAETAGNVVAEFSAIRNGLERDIQDAKSILVIDEIVKSATINPASSTATGLVVFCESTGTFAYKVGNVYFGNWLTSSLYGTSGLNGIVPYSYKVYMFEGSLYAFKENSLNQVSGSGAGNVYNVTSLIPLEEGYYSLQSAIEAIPEKSRCKGLVVTFESEMGKWQAWQYEGTTLESFTVVGAWSEFGGSGTIKSITLNGQVQVPDDSGNVVLNVEQVEVDETLSPESTNPVQNAAVTARLNEIEASTVFDMTAEESDDNTVRLTLTNKSGAEIASVDIPAGSGGGGTGEATTKIVLTSEVDKPILKFGDSASLTYFFDHQYGSGDDKGTSTGQKAQVTITMLKGAQTVYSETFNDVSKGTYTVDLSKYLFVGTLDVYVKAVTVDPNSGSKQTKQSYVSLKVVTLSLISTYNLASKISGYESHESVSIPFTVSGAGTKVVTLYLDGEQSETRTISKSGQTNGSFSVSMADLNVGRHTVQMIAEMEASDNLIITSESVFIDICKSGAFKPSICAMFSFQDGRIFKEDHLTPTLEIGQYEKLEFSFVVYDPTKTPAEMEIYRDGVKTQTISVPRTTQVYTNRFTDQGNVAMKFTCGATNYNFNIDVIQSSIDIEEIKADVALRLVASGRSNSEENPGIWQYEGVETYFTGFDWKSDGWTGDSLKMTNGGAIDINYKPFSTDAVVLGATYEMELKCTNVTDREGIVVECMDSGVGFKMTTQEAIMAAKGGSQVSTLFASGLTLKIAFVVRKRAGSKLLELFVNGIRCGAKKYGETESMLQETPSTIRINSDAADVELRNVRVYKRDLSDDEILTNYMVDRETTEDMVLLFNDNDVMDDEGKDVDIEKLRLKGKSVMRIVGDVNLVNATNNKKFEVPVDIYFYSAYGKEYDFIIRNAGLRIQGTSSTTYPRKNYRLYFLRSDKYGTTLEVNGVDIPDLKYSFKPGARRVGIFCLKADFAESSSTHNTGTVILLNDVWQRCGFLTPPQQVDATVRIGIDGFPMDLFYDNDATGDNIYLGKYNFNNEKSASADVYGFEGVAGFNDAEALAGKANPCICLEFLNNTQPLCLFTTDDMGTFEDALEFRYPEDGTWENVSQGNREAVQRVWSWIYSCRNNPVKFAAEVNQYFDINSLCGWYLYTDYFMAVDQRAKNMMMATWDGLKWYFLPYDCDTILGVRNDSVLKYLYDITHETYDESIKGYAFAGHDSVLWELVRTGLKDKLIEVASAIRSNMSTEYVLKVYNEDQMSNWCERVYNKDGNYKYILPLENNIDYLYAMHGSRFAHRTFTIQNRFALMDSQYVAGTYRKDSFTAYFGYEFSQDNRRVRITASERYYFGYGFTSGTPTQSAVLAEGAGSQVSLTMKGDLIVNDPQYFYGASRMRELDLSDVSHAILQTLNLSNLTALRRLDVSCAATQNTLQALILTGCKNLQSVNMKGLRSEAFSNIDLSANTKLETFNASRTSLTGVTFAKGSLLSSITLPATIQNLELRNLNRLSNSGLILEGTANLQRLVIDGCSLIDWVELFDRCPYVKYLRITGLSLEGDGSLLRTLKTMGGVDEEGGNVETCRLTGRYKLTCYMPDEEYKAFCEHFPELTIMQPEYTMIEFDDTVKDDRNITNLDNNTGYKSGTEYEPSAHITRIMNARYRCLGKQAKEGIMTVYPLHKDNSNYYADADKVTSATPALLDSTQGDVWLYEPHYWYKGINDYLNNKKYACFCANEDKPAEPECTVITLDQIKEAYGWKNKYKVMINKATLTESLSADANFSVCKVDVSGFKKVRFPTVLGTSLVGSSFVDDAGKVISSVYVPTLNSKFQDGMYLISEVPEGATWLHFTIHNNAEFDYVVLSNSDKVEDMEPYWVEHEACLPGVFEAVVIGSSLYSAATGEASVGSLTQPDFDSYARARKLQLVDYEMHKDVANLFYALYGRRDSQDQCGYGQNTNVRIIGNTAKLGMIDTVNPDHKTEYAWYKEMNEDGTIKYVQTPSTNSLGYENWWGNKAEWMGKVSVPNATSAEQYKWYIIMPDGTTRKVKSGITGGFMTGVVHGRYMDIIGAFSQAGSSTTFYCDEFIPSSAVGRVVFRSNSYANSNGGVSQAYCGYDSSSTYAYVGSRLAFRGKIEVAQSVAAFKALKPIG